MKISHREDENGNLHFQIFSPEKECRPCIDFIMPPEHARQLGQYLLDIAKPEVPEEPLRRDEVPEWFNRWWDAQLEVQNFNTHEFTRRINELDKPLPSHECETHSLKERVAVLERRNLDISGRMAKLAGCQRQVWSFLQEEQD